ncbi:hypothetical protein RKD27_000908 [Streptomyces sp. SAI-126]
MPSSSSTGPSAAQNITVRWSDLGLTNANATVRDLWTRSGIGSYGTGHTTSVPAGGSALLTVTGRTEAASSTCTGTSSFSGVAVGTGSGRCLDLYDNTITNGTQAELWDCNGGQNQQWTYTSRTTNGTKVIIWDCNGQSNQKWTLS